MDKFILINISFWTDIMTPIKNTLHTFVAIKKYLMALDDDTLKHILLEKLYERSFFN